MIKIKLSSSIPFNIVFIALVIIASSGLSILFSPPKNSYVFLVDFLIFLFFIGFSLFLIFIIMKDRQNNHLSFIVIYEDCVNFIYKTHNKIAQVKEVDKNNIQSFHIYIDINVFKSHQVIDYVFHLTVKSFEDIIVYERISDVQFKDIISFFKNSGSIPNFSYDTSSIMLKNSIDKLLLTGKENFYLKFLQYPRTIIILLGSLLLIGFGIIIHKF